MTPRNPENDPNAPEEGYVRAGLSAGLTSLIFRTALAQASTPQLQRARAEFDKDAPRADAISVEVAARIGKLAKTAPTSSARSETRTRPAALVATSTKKPAGTVKFVEAELVDAALDLDTPRLIDPKKSVTLCNTFSAEQLEDAIKSGLAATEEHRRQSAIWDLRTGVLFHLFKESLQVKGRKFTGFWAMAEEKFGVSRATISRKMRLAAIWAKELGADEATLQQLAAASDFTNPGDNPAIAGALAWIGEDTTSDLYRRHKLVNVGPQGGYRDTKADGSDRAKKRTKAQIAQDEFEATSSVAMIDLNRVLARAMEIRGPAVKGVAPRSWDTLEDKELDALKLLAHDLHAGCLDSQKRRAAVRKGVQI